MREPRREDSIPPVIILASASPRRADLLTAAGIAFEAVPVDVDERPHEGEAPADHVRRLAEKKARAGAAARPGATVLSADTVVVISNRILGKPADRAEAQQMLRTLSGRVHEVLTAVALIAPPSREPLVEVARTGVRFATLTEAEIGWYVKSGEPMDKAGAYAIQGLASRFVERIEGSYSNVVGLPVALVYRMFTRAGVALHEKPK